MIIKNKKLRIGVMNQKERDEFNDRIMSTPEYLATYFEEEEPDMSAEWTMYDYDALPKEFRDIARRIRL